MPGRQRRCPARPPPLSRPKPNRGGPAPRRAPHPPPAPPLTKGPVRGLPGAARLPRRALLGRGAGGRRGGGFGSGERSGTVGRGRRGGNPPNVSFPRKEPRGMVRGGVSPSSTTPSFHGVALASGKKKLKKKKVWVFLKENLDGSGRGGAGREREEKRKKGKQKKKDAAKAPPAQTGKGTPPGRYRSIRQPRDPPEPRVAPGRRRPVPGSAPPPSLHQLPCGGGLGNRGSRAPGKGQCPAPRGWR